jgi:hypothetical protein
MHKKARESIARDVMVTDKALARSERAFLPLNRALRQTSAARQAGQHEDGGREEGAGWLKGGAIRRHYRELLSVSIANEVCGNMF